MFTVSKDHQPIHLEGRLPKAMVAQQVGLQNSEIEAFPNQNRAEDPQKRCKNEAFLSTACLPQRQADGGPIDNPVPQQQGTGYGPLRKSKQSLSGLPSP